MKKKTPLYTPVTQGCIYTTMSDDGRHYDDANDELHRVRSLLRFLPQYGELKKRKVVPKATFFSGVKKGGSSPKIMKKMGYAEFGLWIEDVIKIAVKSPEKTPAEILEELKPKTPSSLHALLIPKEFKGIVKLARREFVKPDDVVDVIFDVEVKYSPVQGHPDIIRITANGEVTIYDIKTTAQFNAMRLDTVFQLLSYYALLHLAEGEITIKSGNSSPFDIGGTEGNDETREGADRELILQMMALFGFDTSDLEKVVLFTQKSVESQALILPGSSKTAPSTRRVPLPTAVAVFLPIQQLVMKVDVRGWDYIPFYEELRGCIAKKFFRESLYEADALVTSRFYSAVNKHVGAHVPGPELLKLIEKGYRVPFQFFLAGRLNAKKTAASGKTKLKKYISEYNLDVYVHAIYSTNLSNPAGKMRDTDVDCGVPWAVLHLVQVLKECDILGIKGLVVHCGSKGEMCGSMSHAVQVMRDSVIQIIELAGELNHTKLLLENPAGEKGDTLSDPERFAVFLMSLPEHVRPSVGVCVDTCHSHAASHKPSEFVRVLKENSIDIDLFHYNDSLLEQGCCRDRHANIGDGYVGIHELRWILEFALREGVPMVRE